MTFTPPVSFNIADHFLDARVREGRGERVALVTDARTWSYRDVQALANRYGHLLREAGVMPEQRVIVALPDGPEFVAALPKTDNLKTRKFELRRDPLNDATWDREAAGIQLTR